MCHEALHFFTHQCSGAIKPQPLSTFLGWSSLQGPLCAAWHLCPAHCLLRAPCGWDASSLLPSVLTGRSPTAWLPSVAAGQFSGTSSHPGFLPAAFVITVACHFHLLFSSWAGPLWPSSLALGQCVLVFSSSQTTFSIVVISLNTCSDICLRCLLK